MAKDDEMVSVPKSVLEALGSHDKTGEDHLAEMMAVAEENERLRNVLREARAEVDRWGHGDMHYGAMPRDKGVLAMLAKIDGVLG